MAVQFSERNKSKQKVISQLRKRSGHFYVSISRGGRGNSAQRRR